MNFTDQIFCPLPGMGHCCYERCPFCDAACLQSRLAGETEISEDCCLIHWTEDFD